MPKCSLGEPAAAEADSLMAMVQAARAGQADVRDSLIRQYQPFILRVAASISRRFLKPGQDDEFGVAMMGFNEAIDCYNPAGKVPFLSFAELVMRRRLVDHFRSQSAHLRELPLSSLEQDGEDERDYLNVHPLVYAAESAHARWEESMERREEIALFQGILNQYGLDYRTLAKATPKHSDTRRRLLEISHEVAAASHLVREIRRRRALPIGEIADLSGLSRKTIERHRKYLLGLILALTSDLPIFHSYLALS